MDKEKIQQEFASIASDLKEQVLYLQDLGVKTFDTELPKLPTELTSKKVESVENKNFAVSDEIFKKVPEIDESVMRVVSSEHETSKDLDSLLNSSKLSNLGARSERTEIKNQSTEDAKPVIENKMPETKPLEESLFGDITEKLPESDETLEMIREDIGKDCTRCKLCEGRTQVVNSVGNPQADLMFVGEAPGADEDAQGEPFVGRAGKLLTKIIEAMQLKREDVFIGNINRCRPPKNRQPLAEEAEVCKPFLLREISAVRPKVIVVMGNTACQNLLDTKVGITKLRGKFQDYYGVKVMPTFHPAYLLRDPRKKREVWDDMKLVMTYLKNN